ncbi:uncharacterized protein AB9X84_005877 isoform 1-T1 [Acanthopagrus schlegelii]
MAGRREPRWASAGSMIIGSRMRNTRTTTLKAEMLWVLQTVSRHHSYTSNEDVSTVFKAMFPDSECAKTFSCGEDKTCYLARFGLAPYIKRELLSSVNQGTFVIMFDESMNRTTKNKQLDLHVRYWVNDENGSRVQSRYLGSQYMGHSTAEDLLEKFKECTKELNLRNMLSLSMDGPSVNWKFVNLLQKEHAEQFAGTQIQIVGSCGLHTLHNAFKGGFELWMVEKVLKARHFLFHCAPARREDFTSATATSTFPLPFCGHRWLENLPAVERALEVWPSIVKYVELVKSKKVKNPGTSSFDSICEAQMDPLLLAKFHFFMAISRAFQPFLAKYQTDVPMMPFLWEDLENLIRNLLKRFIKRDALPLTPFKLVRLDVMDQKLWLSPKEVDIGMGATAVIKELSGAKGRVSDLGVLQFRKDCQVVLSNICKKALDKCPLKYSVVHNMMCLDPKKMHSKPDDCLEKIKALIQKFVQDKVCRRDISW